MLRVPEREFEIFKVCNAFLNRAQRLLYRCGIDNQLCILANSDGAHDSPKMLGAVLARELFVRDDAHTLALEATVANA